MLSESRFSPWDSHLEGTGQKELTHVGHSKGISSHTNVLVTGSSGRGVSTLEPREILDVSWTASGLHPSRGL